MIVADLKHGELPASTSVQARQLLADLDKIRRRTNSLLTEAGHPVTLFIGLKNGKPKT